MSKQEPKTDASVDEINVNRILGAPGTGKTTHMVGNVGLEKDGLFIEYLEEYDLDEIMLVSYTNSGVDEATDRLYEMTDHYKKDLEERVTTIHSRCWSILGKDYTNLVTWRDEQAFCKQSGIKYSKENDDDDGDVMTGQDKSPGNIMIEIYQWLKSNRLDLSEHEKYPGEWPPETTDKLAFGVDDDEYLLEEHRAEAHEDERALGPLLKAWDMYKETNDLFDFTDLIEEVVEMNVDILKRAKLGDTEIDDDIKYLDSVRNDPEALRKKKAMRGRHGFIDTKVLFVDEFQDVTALQHAWYQCQKLVCDEVYVAGDDDQTIYGFSGANAEFLLHEEGSTTILSDTYRVPRDIWKACQKCIGQVEEREQKNVEPVSKDGSFETLYSPNKVQIASVIEQTLDTTDEEIMILFRTNNQVNAISRVLNQLGIPYNNMSTFVTWTNHLEKMSHALGKLNRGGKITPDELKMMLDNAVSSKVTGNKKEHKETIFGQTGVEEVSDMFRLRGQSSFVRWYVNNALNKETNDNYNYFKLVALENNVLKENTNYDPSRINIGTIHSSKGKEAGTVIVGTDTSKGVMESQKDECIDPSTSTEISDDERRVMYVGMSRSSRRLVLIDNAISSKIARTITSTMPAPAWSIEGLLGDEFTKDKKTSSTYER